MRRIRRGIALAGSLMLAASAAGCGEASTSAKGTWGADASGETQLTFTQEGLISGTDGCNTLSGTWEQNDDDVTFSGLASTLMACPDIDVWLVDPATATIDGDTMHIFNSDGTQIGDLDRA